MKSLNQDILKTCNLNCKVKGLRDFRMESPLSIIIIFFEKKYSIRSIKELIR